MKILVASSIDVDAIAYLRAHHEVTCAFNASPEALKAHMRACQVLIFRSGVQISAELMACAPALQLIIRAGSGFDNIDLDYLRDHQIKMVRIPGPGAQAVAEMAFAHMLALARQLREADRLLRLGRWAKYELEGFLLSGKTLGIVGCGNIGSRTGQLGVAWGMHVIGCTEHNSVKDEEKFLKKGITLKRFDEVLSQADFLSIHVPLHSSTRNLINAETLALLKPDAFLINLARGGVVNEQDLHAALRAGRLRGAALDVHENEGEGKISPLAELPNVLLTPHIGAMTVDSQREIGRIVVQTLQAFIVEHQASNGQLNALELSAQ